VSLVTEEVESGVLRIINDGVRDLARPTGIRDYDVYDSAIAAGRDGSVWVFSRDRFFRLGDEAEHAWDGARFIFSMAPSVAPDGTPWWLDGEVLRSFDGKRWRVELRRANGFHMWPDGTMWTRDRRGHLLRGDGTSWTDVHAELGNGDPDAWPGRLWVSPRIDESLADDLDVSDPAFEVLYDGTRNHNGLSIQFIGSDGSDSHGPAGAVQADIRHVDMADAGDWWIYQTLEVPLAGSASSGNTTRIHYLVHVKDGYPRVYTDDDGVPETGPTNEGKGLMEAGPGDRVWMSVGAHAGTHEECDGVVSFDGATWQRFLRGACVYDLDVAQDGSVWVQAGRADGRQDAVDTYVIRPKDAMADR
jgi:hypothetical protein